MTKDVDVVNEVAGNFGKWQLRALLIIFLCKIPAVWFLAILAFTAPAPKSGDFWCLPPNNITNHTEWVLQSHPVRKAATDKEFQIDFCRVYKDAYQDDTVVKYFEFSESKNISVRENRRVIPCEKFHFKNDFHSVIKEYKLVCSRRLLTTVSQCFHIIGSSVGGIVVHFMLKRSRNWSTIHAKFIKKKTLFQLNSQIQSENGDAEWNVCANILWDNVRSNTILWTPRSVSMSRLCLLWCYGCFWPNDQWV